MAPTPKSRGEARAQSWEEWFLSTRGLVLIGVFLIILTTALCYHGYVSTHGR
jgi:hypothetical protein